MLHQLMATAGLLALLLPSNRQNPDPQLAVLTLQEALDQQKISVEAVSLGGNSAECVALHIQNHSLRPMTVILPEGTLFEPANAEDQSLVVPVQRLMALSGRSTESLNIAAYCSEIEDRSPAEETTFTLSRSANPHLDSLYRYLALHPRLTSSPDLLQSAIWAITDDADVGSIYDESLSDEVPAFREWICALLGKEDVWYNTILETRLDEERRIVREALSVQGEFTLNRRQPTVLQGHVEDEHGEVVWFFDQTNSLPAGMLRFRFALEVEGWDSGNYAVVYKAGSEELIRREFRI